jgi:hypothetical protein
VDAQRAVEALGKQSQFVEKMEAKETKDNKGRVWRFGSTRRKIMGSTA